MRSTCRYYIFNHPLNARGLEGFGEDKAAFKFTLHKNVISKPCFLHPVMKIFTLKGYNEDQQ